MFILYGTGANLNWLIERALRWKREGLNVPALITNATDEYRGGDGWMDVIGNFPRERCVQRPGAAIRARELFQVYQDWCDENNGMATSERIDILIHHDFSGGTGQYYISSEDFSADRTGRRLGVTAG
jgi:phage/plasmid-associated DNA primase